LHDACGGDDFGRRGDPSEGVLLEGSR
jgi:hypothetical protein